MSITKTLSKFIYELEYSDLSAQVIETTKLYIADYYAALAAGIWINKEFNEKVTRLILDTGGVKEASVFMTTKKIPVEQAAFLNALYAHGADMDDGNRKAMGHTAVSVMSAVFAIAEKSEASGQDIITAINAGYEVCNRVAAAAQPGLAHRGFHSTGTAGALGAAAACAKLMKLNEKEIYSAISLAAVQSSGLILVSESGQCCKPINPANAAKTGVFSAKLAELGIDTPKKPLESDKGWLHAMSEHVDIKEITETLGKIYTIAESYLKLYPACRHTHCVIDAALALRKHICEKQFVDKIEKIDISIYENAIRYTGTIKYPKSSGEAKFSLYYAFAKAFLVGRYGFDEIEEPVISVEEKALIDKINLIPDNTYEDKRRGIRGAKVVLTTTDGKVFEEVVTIPKGEAGNPVFWEEIGMKVKTCFAKEPAINYKNVIKYIQNFEKLQKYHSINECLICID
ncbi:MmgE/PrpD family protein [Mediterraneibacter massiliensis]|uniref:MmgE/PrpD family protein n=1 Tax=Mediterraneibacter massiliensis TaxID=1720300 RepID=UPI0022E1B6CB|nr:MmgE/PrpD family protein [Mediterraneibacter massiliensis]